MSTTDFKLKEGVLILCDERFKVIIIKNYEYEPYS